MNIFDVKVRGDGVISDAVRSADTQRFAQPMAAGNP